MKDFVSATFRCVLRFTAALLTWEQNVTLPLDLPRRNEAAIQYMCMLYNDEVHTYDQVRH